MVRLAVTGRSTYVQGLPAAPARTTGFSMEKHRTTTALVTGSTRGIGLAIAEALEARGMRVIRHGTRAEGENSIAADLGDPVATAQLWDQACAMAGGRVDVLVNNAGVFEASPIDNTDAYWLAEWERCLRVNLTSAAQLSRLAVRQWL